MAMLTQRKLLKTPMSRLLKVELPRFALRLTETVDRHDAEELKIDKMFNLLLAERPAIDRLIDKYGPHPMTEELEALRKDRSLRLSEIRFHLKVVMREDKSGEDKDVMLTRIAINHFFQNLDLSTNEEMFNQKIDHFFEAINNDLELMTALESLGFTVYIDKLQQVHAFIKHVITQRSISMSERLKYTTEELKNIVLLATRNLVKQIELAPFLNPEIDYDPLYIEMNQLFTEFKNIINKRVLFNKRKAEAKVDNQSTQTAVTNLIADSAQDMSSISAEEVTVNVNGSKAEPVDNEKAAATSSKTMQLPLVDNENGALEK